MHRLAQYPPYPLHNQWRHALHNTHTAHDARLARHATTCDSLAGRIHQQFLTYAEQHSFTFLRESGRRLVPEITMYGDLDRQVRGVAAWLSARTESEQPVVLLFEPGVEFWRAFLGCVYAGVTAVPAPLPHDQRSMDRLASILRDSGSNLVLTTAELRDAIAAGLAAVELDAPVQCVAVDQSVADADGWTMPRTTADTPAFIQYTSGSTGIPKGVVVTHGNILHNIAAMTSALGLDSNHVLVGWVPHFHDMGLISQLTTFANGASLAIMSPLSFIKQPRRLLQAVSDQRATVIAAPNFAYDLIARRVSRDDLEGLDLSSVRVALNGAEPIRRRTIEAVTDLLAHAGMRATTMRPGYGLAEVTVLATVTPESEALRYFAADGDALERGELAPAEAGGRVAALVSSGVPAKGIGVIIVDPETRRRLPDNQVGEIWLSGGSVAKGYFNRTRETEETFGAHTTDGEGPFLRTGDLGAFHGGHLFVTGRRKDLIIINGRNLYPHDIEALVGEVHPATSDARGVAVSVEAGEGERLVVIQSIRTERLYGMALEQLAKTIAATISRSLEIPAPTVVLVDRKAIHLTTSGKVQRSSMRAAFLRNELTGVLHESVDRALAGAR